MKFNLSDSPLRNFFKYDSDNIYELMLPFVRDFVSHQHEMASTPLPPGAFVLKEDKVSYLNGYNFEGPTEFLNELIFQAKTAEAIITVSEFGTLEQDFSQGLVLICVQSRSYYRCRAFRLITGEDFEVYEDPYRILLPSDPDQSAGSEVENVCHLVGIDALVHPVF